MFDVQSCHGFIQSAAPFLASRRLNFSRSRNFFNPRKVGARYPNSTRIDEYASLPALRLAAPLKRAMPTTALCPYGFIAAMSQAQRTPAAWNCGPSFPFVFFGTAISTTTVKSITTAAKDRISSQVCGSWPASCVRCAKERTSGRGGSPWNDQIVTREPDAEHPRINFSLARGVCCV